MRKGTAGAQPGSRGSADGPMLGRKGFSARSRTLIFSFAFGVADSKDVFTGIFAWFALKNFGSWSRSQVANPSPSTTGKPDAERRTESDTDRSRRDEPRRRLYVFLFANALNAGFGGCWCCYQVLGAEPLNTSFAPRRAKLTLPAALRLASCSAVRSSLQALSPGRMYRSTARTPRHPAARRESQARRATGSVAIQGPR